jgi:hypothetical protein
MRASAKQEFFRAAGLPIRRARRREACLRLERGAVTANNASLSASNAMGSASPQFYQVLTVKEGVKIKKLWPAQD